MGFKGLNRIEEDRSNEYEKWITDHFCTDLGLYLTRYEEEGVSRERIVLHLLWEAAHINHCHWSTKTLTDRLEYYCSGWEGALKSLHNEEPEKYPAAANKDSISELPVAHKLLQKVSDEV